LLSVVAFLMVKHANDDLCLWVVASYFVCLIPGQLYVVFAFDDMKEETRQFTGIFQATYAIYLLIVMVKAWTTPKPKVATE